jgi:hypothetical protein
MRINFESVIVDGLHSPYSRIEAEMLSILLFLFLTALLQDSIYRLSPGGASTGKCSKRVTAVYNGRQRERAMDGAGRLWSSLCLCGHAMQHRRARGLASPLGPADDAFCTSLFVSNVVLHLLFFATFYSSLSVTSGVEQSQTQCIYYLCPATLYLALSCHL